MSKKPWHPTASISCWVSRIVSGAVSQDERRKLLDKGTDLTLEQSHPAMQITRSHCIITWSHEQSTYYQDEGWCYYSSQQEPWPWEQLSRHGPYVPRHNDICPAKGTSCTSRAERNHCAKVSQSNRVNALETESANEEQEILLANSLTVGFTTKKKKPLRTAVLVHKSWCTSIDNINRLDV